jgi:hypothetical protein
MDIQLSLQWLKNDYKSFDMNINKPNLTPTYIHTYLPTHPPPTYLPPTTYLFKLSISYNLPISYVPSSNLPTIYFIVL